MPHSWELFSEQLSVVVCIIPILFYCVLMFALITAAVMDPGTIPKDRNPQSGTCIARITHITHLKDHSHLSGIPHKPSLQSVDDSEPHRMRRTVQMPHMHITASTHTSTLSCSHTPGQ